MQPPSIFNGKPLTKNHRGLGSGPPALFPSEGLPGKAFLGNSMICPLVRSCQVNLIKGGGGFAWNLEGRHPTQGVLLQSVWRAIWAGRAPVPSLIFCQDCNDAHASVPAPGKKGRSATHPAQGKVTSVAGNSWRNQAMRLCHLERRWISLGGSMFGLAC